MKFWRATGTERCRVAVAPFAERGDALRADGCEAKGDAPVVETNAYLLPPHASLLVEGSACEVELRLAQLRRRRAIATAVVQRRIQHSVVLVADRSYLEERYPLLPGAALASPRASTQELAEESVCADSCKTGGEQRQRCAVPLPVALAALVQFVLGRRRIGIYWCAAGVEGAWVCSAGVVCALSADLGGASAPSRWVVLTTEAEDAERFLESRTELSLPLPAGVDALTPWQWLALGVALAAGELGTFPASKTWDGDVGGGALSWGEEVLPLRRGGQLLLALMIAVALTLVAVAHDQWQQLAKSQEQSAELRRELELLHWSVSEETRAGREGAR